MYNRETNCDLQFSTERAAEEGTCSGYDFETARRSVKKKRIYVVLMLCAMNLTTCTLLPFIYTNNHSLLVVGFLNLTFTLLAAIAVAASLPQLIIVCVLYKILCGTYLSFLICKLIDSVVAKRSTISYEDIWIIIAFICTGIELRLLMNFKVETEERTMPPPKYSSCALVPSLTNSQLPTYDEALKMIENQQKDETKEQSCSGCAQASPVPPPPSSLASQQQSAPPIYTVQNTGSTRTIFRHNPCI